jgi:hypothetical protein
MSEITWADVDEWPDPPKSEAMRVQDYYGCRFIEGEPSPPRRGLFCGRPPVPGGSWCPEHREIVYRRWVSKRGRGAAGSR